jgi:hypothetical protein
MLDTSHPYAYFYPGTGDLAALLDYSQPEKTLLRTNGTWKSMTEPQLDLLDGMEITMMDEAIIPVIDEADADGADLTKDDLKQYILPMDLGKNG